MKTIDKINKQQTYQPIEPQAGSSNPLRTVRSRISSIFHQKDNFEKQFPKKLDKTISLSTIVSENEITYKLFIDIWDTLDDYTELKRKAKNFIERFEIIHNKEQKAICTLLKLIINHEDLNKALQIIDNKIRSTTQILEKSAIVRIKRLINKRFNIENSEKAVNPNKFVPTLSTILEEEPRTRVIIHSTKL